MANNIYGGKEAEDSGSCTAAEYRQAEGRIFFDSIHRLALGPIESLGLGCATVFALSCTEGHLHLDPNIINKANKPAGFQWQQFRLVTRYGLANMIPSIIWDRIEAITVAKALDIPTNILRPVLPPRETWRRKTLQSLRGGIAGTVLIAQLIHLVQTTTDATNAYRQRIAQGEEPPLQDPSQTAVVMRLVGNVSDTTALSMQREGRRKYLPIVEQPGLPFVQQLITEYSRRSNSSVLTNSCSVPVVWHVPDGQYGKKLSWDKLVVPKHWLFDRIRKNNSTTTSTQSKVLILEADATLGEDLDHALAPPSSPIKHVRPSNSYNANADGASLDLNLYEVAQGFYYLSKQVVKDAPNHDVLRVLLANTRAKVQSGGGQKQTVRDYVQSRDLADVVIDAQQPLFHALTNWLLINRQQQQQQQQQQTREERASSTSSSSWSPKWGWRWGNAQAPMVVLETPSATCFEVLRSLFEKHGYAIMELSEAQKGFSADELRSLPIVVCERTTQDTIHTVRRLLTLNPRVVQPQNVCALCPTHHGLVEKSNEDDDESGASISKVTTICTSDVHDQLFRYVRGLAVENHTAIEIQDMVDNEASKVIAKELSLEIPSE